METGARAVSWETDGGVFITSDSDSSLPVVTTSLSQIGVEGIFVRDCKQEFKNNREHEEHIDTTCCYVGRCNRGRCQQKEVFPRAK